MKSSTLVLTAVMTLGVVGEAAAQSQGTPESTQTVPNGVAAQTQLNVGYSRAFGSLFSPNNLAPTEPLTGPLSSVGNWLENVGVNIRVPLYEQAMNNISEGSRPGVTASASWILPSIDFDLDKIAGIPNARIRVMEEIHFLKLADGTDIHTGFQGAADSGYLGFQHRLTKEPNTLSELTYDQLLLDQRLEVELGRMNFKRYFFTPNCDANQLTCGLNQINANTQIAPPAFSEWAGRTAYNITPYTYVQLGASEIDPHGKSTRGFDFGDGQATGYITMAELAYKTSFASTAYPEFWEFGGYSLHAPHNDPVNTKLIINNSPGIVVDGSKTVWRADSGATNSDAVRHVNLYFQSAQGLDQTNVYSTQISVGGTFYGPILSRPYDFIGAKVTYLTLTSHEQQYLAGQRFAAGGPNAFPGTSWYLELNGQVKVFSGGFIEPVVQYVIDPDTVNNPKVKYARSGFVLGLTMVIGLEKLLGLGG